MIEETRQWSIVSIVGDLIPSARDGHSACLIDDRMYIFGGFEDDVRTERERERERDIN